MRQLMLGDTSEDLVARYAVSEQLSVAAARVTVTAIHDMFERQPPNKKCYLLAKGWEEYCQAPQPGDESGFGELFFEVVDDSMCFFELNPNRKESK